MTNRCTETAKADAAVYRKAARLKVSRTTISNHVRALKAEGRWQP